MLSWTAYPDEPSIPTHHHPIPNLSDGKAPAFVFAWSRNSDAPLFPVPAPGVFIGMDALTSTVAAGAVAGAASRTVVSPMERLKIILQVQGPSQEYRGTFPSLAKIWREEGFKGYMKGNGVNVLRIAPYSAVQFSSYELVKAMLADDDGLVDTPRRLLAGSIAGIASVVSTYPLDLVRSRLSIESASLGLAGGPPGKSSGIIGMTIKVAREEGGIRALYRGTFATAAGVAPYVGLNFAAFEYFKQFLTTRDGAPPGTLVKLAIGAAAGSISQTLTYPFDVLRRRMQVLGMNKTPGHERQGAWQVTKAMVQREGFRSLYKGIVPNLLKVGPSIGVSFASYELVKDLLDSRPLKL